MLLQGLQEEWQERAVLFDGQLSLFSGRTALVGSMLLRMFFNLFTYLYIVREYTGIYPKLQGFRQIACQKERDNPLFQRFPRLVR